MSIFENLQPRSVWAHFSTLCRIPRASLHEAALREHLIEWAKDLGIASRVDAAGNLILSKPATPGGEAAPGVILQGHLDMVCQANSGTRHDFLRDPITPVIEDGWLVAKDTTLGADNGIGVALALAMLEEADAVHPAIEVLLTVNEESGMDGARGLASGELEGSVLINLDTEEWGYFYLGCAGGVDVEVRCDLEREAYQAGYVTIKLAVSGLKGGHSGIDINAGRGNAILLLAEALRTLSVETDLRLISMQGGTARNAIPREACAIFAAPADSVNGLGAVVASLQTQWQARYPDERLTIVCNGEDGGMQNTLTCTERDRLLDFIGGTPNGVARMSAEFDGVVDTSSNLGVILLEAQNLSATFKVRSLSDDRANALARDLVARAKELGFAAWQDGAYPGWTPNRASPLLAMCGRVYEEQFGRRASLQVIHAGLECGLLASSHAHLDMISFGPDIKGAHAPGESVRIASVGQCWQLLKAVLQALAHP